MLYELKRTPISIFMRIIILQIWIGILLLNQRNLEDLAPSVEMKLSLALGPCIVDVTGQYSQVVPMVLCEQTQGDKTWVVYLLVIQI
jgi:hypothetical protein